MSAAPSAYQEIEEIEIQLDVCARRIRELEDHVRTEIEQQKEDMHRLRSQLRRTIEAIAEVPLSAPDDEAATAAPDTATLDASDHLLPEMAVPAAPSAFGYEASSFADPFEAVLPDTPGETEDEPIEEPTVDPFASETVEGSADEEPVAESGETVAEEEAQPDRPTWGDPFDAEAMSDFIIPAEAFASTFEPDPALDPFADAVPPADEEEAKEPKSLSEFDRLLDWSDFGPDEAEEHDAPALHFGDGTSAVPVLPPTLRVLPPTLRADRPVPITQRARPEAKLAGNPQRDEHDLTVIPGIDDATQALLRRLGVTTLDEIASWHRADAVRIASLLGTVSSSEIFDRWVLEAQSALFDLFQQRLRRTRFHNLDDL